MSSAAPVTTAKAKIYLAGDGKGPPTLGSVLALCTRLTGKDLTPEEIKEARQYLATLSKVDLDQVTLDTRVAPAKRQPSTEDENAAEASQSRRDPPPPSSFAPAEAVAVQLIANGSAKRGPSAGIM
jgi:hypothetical protein